MNISSLTDLALPLDQLEIDMKSCFDTLVTESNQKRLDLESQNRNLFVNIQKKQEYIEQIEQQLKENTACKAVITERLEGANTELSEKIQLIDKIKSDLEESVSALVTSEAKEKETREQLEKEKKEFAMMEAHEKVLTIQVEKLKMKVFELKKILQLQHNSATIAKLEEQIDAASKMYKEAKTDLDVTTKDLSAYETKQEVISKEMRRLKVVEQKHYELVSSLEKNMSPTSDQMSHLTDTVQGDEITTPRAENSHQTKKKRRIQLGDQDTKRKSVRTTFGRKRENCR
ncbi:hypothetical protein Ciccas_001412 [Cichlidogyrus casuarinus]|uniref:Uncharacterized protein n=1 Tax=Cichlidogyrus casuarinus TaxID=1844966 RepID=A0ABD2QK35_9PLAT